MSARTIDPTDPQFAGHLAKSPFRWQGDHGALTWLDELVTIGAVPAPRPVITNLNPPAVPAGGALTEIIVTGTGFVVGCRMMLSGSESAVSFVSATQVRAPITTAMVPVAGVFPFAIRNPDFQISAPATLTVT